MCRNRNKIERIVSVIPVHVGAVDCSSTTVLARQVTLEWSAPPSSQDLKYILNCLIMNSNFSIVTLDTTVNITTGIVPFTNYTCNLTAKTTIDTSAPILCKFETAQDSKHLNNLWNNDIICYFLLSSK